MNEIQSLILTKSNLSTWVQYFLTEMRSKIGFNYAQCDVDDLIDMYEGRTVSDVVEEELSYYHGDL